MSAEYLVIKGNIVYRQHIKSISVKVTKKLGGDLIIVVRTNNGDTHVIKSYDFPRKQLTDSGLTSEEINILSQSWDKARMVVVKKLEDHEERINQHIMDEEFNRAFYERRRVVDEEINKEAKAKIRPSLIDRLKKFIA